MVLNSLIKLQVLIQLQDVVTVVVATEDAIAAAVVIGVIVVHYAEVGGKQKNW